MGAKAGVDAVPTAPPETVVSIYLDAILANGARREQRVGEPGVVNSQGYADWGYFLLKMPDGRWRIAGDGRTP